MCFKRMLSLWLSVALFASATGCGLNTGEAPPQPPPPSFSGDGYSCVGQIADFMDAYFNDRTSEEEITTFVRCLQKSFVAFAQLTRGRDQDTYRPEEIRRFLQEHFFRARPITDRLMREFMVIKQAMMGGTLDRITRQELYDTVEFMEDMRKEAIRLKPHVRVLNPRLADAQDARDLGDRLHQAGEALRMAIATFAGRLSKGKAVYTFQSLEDFLNEFRSFVNWEEHFKENSKPASAWKELLRVFKDVAVTPLEPGGVRPGDWTPLLNTMARWYLAYLQYRVGVKGKPVLEGVGLQNLIFLGDEIFRLVEEALSRQPTRTLSFDQIIAMTKALQDLDWVSRDIRSEGLRQAMEAAFGRMFGDPRLPFNQRRVRVLKQSTLNSMHADFDRWAGIQVELDKRLRRRQQTPEVPSIQSASRFPFINDIRLRLANLDDAEWDDFMKLKERRLMARPLFTEQPGELLTITVAPEKELRSLGVTNEFYNLSRMNLIRALVTLLFRGYSQSGSTAGWQTGITSEEMQRFYLDFRTLMIDLNLSDPRSDSSGSHAFVEGNLFTYSADGLRPADDLSGKLTFVETMEMTAFLWSGGLLSKQFYKKLIQECGRGPNDIMGDPKVARCCVYKHLPQVMMEELGNMPALRRYMANQKDHERAEFVETLLQSVYAKDKSDPMWLEEDELVTLAGVLHFAETIMTRFDLDDDGTLTTAEIAAGPMPVFTGFIQKIDFERKKNRGEENPKPLATADAQKAFFFILKYKRIPDPQNWGDWSAMVAMKAGWPKLNINRRELADVFKVIISELVAPPATAEAANKAENQPISRQQCGPE